MPGTGASSHAQKVSHAQSVYSTHAERVNALHTKRVNGSSAKSVKSSRAWRVSLSRLQCVQMHHMNKMRRMLNAPMHHITSRDKSVTCKAGALNVFAAAKKSCPSLTKSCQGVVKEATASGCNYHRALSRCIDCIHIYTGV